ncbi:cytochrome P450 [Acaryochloris sp. IP29b_bin.137]|uniref:cytochrome P450 n=1 Tax=Acaryochloris sp. IP29b_bin.137 TaxID=2969217 RepID=UPI00260F987B|nr:cytochrome P450 [Acaryochloris sp. IP29b_bin.137]
MIASRLPEGPQVLPLRQKLQWLTNPLKLLETYAQLYGDIFTIPIGLSNVPVVLISNPQGIQEIFNANSKQLDSGKAAGIKPPFLGPQSLIALSGNRHKQQRKLLTPPFHGERMRAYKQLICNITKLVISRWKIGETFSVRSSMQEISFQVILKAIFGLEDGPRYQQLKQLLMTRLEGTESIFRIILLMFPVLQKDWGPLSPWGRLVHNEQQINELIYAEIAERRKKPDSSRTDILSLMIAARDETGEQMSDIELRDELITLLVAGHETTATSLAWAFYWIHYLPQVHEKLIQELDSLNENHDSNALFQLPYLNAVCQETLRFYPVTTSAFQRVVKSPIKIMGYQLEPGTLLSPSIYLTHHREDIYPEPKKFKPERFLERQFSPYEYLPFGGGNRRCIGMAFAQFEMKLVLATVLSNWELKLADSKPVKPARRGLLISPSEGVRMVVSGKRPQNQKVYEGISSVV